MSKTKKNELVGMQSESTLHVSDGDGEATDNSITVTRFADNTYVDIALHNEEDGLESLLSLDKSETKKLIAMLTLAIT